MDEPSLEVVLADYRRAEAEVAQQRAMAAETGLLADKAVCTLAAYLTATRNASVHTAETDAMLRDPLCWEGLAKCLADDVMPVDGVMGDVLVRPVLAALERLGDRDCLKALTPELWDRLLAYRKCAATENYRDYLEIAAALFVLRELVDALDAAHPTIADSIRFASADLDDPRLRQYEVIPQVRVQMRRERSPARR